MDVKTEKNKLAPSQHEITCIFDKYTGINKFWSEYEFLSELMPGEKKIYKTKKPPFKLMITKSGAWSQLKVESAQDSSINYSSPKFYRKDAKNKYETDAEFKQWFDYAVDLAVMERIQNGLFKCSKDEIVNIQTDEVCVDETLTTQYESTEPVEEDGPQPKSSIILSDGNGGGLLHEHGLIKQH